MSIFDDLENLSVDTSQDVIAIANIPSSYTNHTGGAYGGDTFGDIIGREFGFNNHKHYRPYDSSKVSVTLRNRGVKGIHLTHAETDYGRGEVNKLLNKQYKDNITGNLQGRNYFQVIYADAVYCIAKIINMNTISGGTNTAFQLAITLNKPVYVYDVEIFGWYRYNPETKQLESMAGETPKLSYQYALVGTRDIEDYKVKSKTNGMWVSREQYLGDGAANLVKEALRVLYKNAIE